MSTVQGLLDTNFISEVRHIEWFSNVVMVKKSSGQWRMCVDYINLNRAYQKDSYPLLNIDNLVYNLADYKLLSFMDAYSDYNRILMFELYMDKITFMIEKASYHYNVIPFSLKIYQRLMKKSSNKRQVKNQKFISMM